MEESASFAFLLRRYRQAAELTQEALAEQAGLSVRAISDLERGVKRPRGITVTLLGAALSLQEPQRRALRNAARLPLPGAVHAAAHRVAHDATAAASAPHLVGRTRECGALHRGLTDALAGHGSLILIGGAAGIGKTALAEVLCRQSRAQGARVAVGHCYDPAETLPYGPWREALASLPLSAGQQRMPVDLAHPHPAAGLTSQSDLFAHVLTVLEETTHEQAVVMLLDDMQWADPASLDLLRSVNRRLAALPLVVLVTYREDELTRRHPLFQLLPALVREGSVQRLDLRGLEVHDVRALVRQRYRLDEQDTTRLSTYLQGRAAGNPFFIGELLRTLEADGLLLPTEQGWVLGTLTHVRVPNLLHQVIEGRLARLGDEARSVLEVAAVIGYEASLALWATVTAATDDVLAQTMEQALEAHLLEASADGDGVRFAHALIRDVLYESIPAPRRRSWHRGVGEALATRYAAPDPDVVANHFQRAADRRAVEWLIRAGERAQRAYAWLSAAARFQAALESIDAQDTEGRRGWLLFRLALLRRLEYPDQGVAYLQEAECLGKQRGDRALAGTALFNLGLLRCMSGDVVHGMSDLEAGVQAFATLNSTERAQVRALDRYGDALDGANGQGELTLWLAEVGRFAEARALAERLITAQSTSSTEEAITDDSLGDAYYGLAWSYAAMGEPREARRFFARARAAFRTIGHRFMVVSTLWYELRQVVLPYLADHVVERRRLAVETIQAVEQIETTTSLFPRHFGLIDLLIIEGEWAEARAMLLTAASAPISQLFTLHPLGLLAWRQGDRELAWARVRAVYLLGPDTPPGAVVSYAIGLQRLAVQLCLEEGDLSAARQWLEADDRWLQWSGSVLGRADALLGWATYHRAANDPAQSRTLAAAALAQATTPRQPLTMLAAHRFLGELETSATRWTAAETHLEHALTLSDACMAPFERALTLLALAELRQARGDRPTACTLLETVRALCEPLDAQPTLARVDALTAEMAATPAVSGAALGGLTPRETEVLRLLAGGLSNAAIAERLVVSPRTVNAHLTTIYGKLGVSSRSAAVVTAINRGLR